MHDDSELDRLLDAALKTCGEAEPSPDLARRILNRAQQDSPKRHPILAWGWGWAWPLATAVAAILLMTLVLAHDFAVAPLPVTVASIPGPPALRSAETHAQLRRAGRTYRGLAAFSPRTRTTAPARAALTGPRPLALTYTPQELVLIAFVEQHPKEAQEVQEAARRDMEPLHEQPLVIAPVQIDPIAPEARN